LSTQALVSLYPFRSRFHRQ